MAGPQHLSEESGGCIQIPSIQRTMQSTRAYSATYFAPVSYSLTSWGGEWGMHSIFKCAGGRNDLTPPGLFCHAMSKFCTVYHVDMIKNDLRTEMVLADGEDYVGWCFFIIERLKSCS